MKYILEVTKTTFNLGNIRKKFKKERGKHVIIRNLQQSTTTEASKKRTSIVLITTESEESGNNGPYHTNKRTYTTDKQMGTN